MKNTILTTCLLLLAVSLLQAQAPNLLPWQGAFRDKDDQPQNGMLDLRFRLLQGSASSSTIAFEEINNNVPLKLGVASHVLGSIDTAGFAAINWSNGPYFLEVARFNGGSAPEVVGMPEQLKSVPYALEAKGLDLPFDGSAQSDNASGLTIRNSGGAIWGRTMGNGNTSGIVGDCITANTGIGVRAAHASGTWAHLATPTESAHFNGVVAVDNGWLQINNAGSTVQLGTDPNAYLELKGGIPYIDFINNGNNDFDARLILQGDKKLAYDSPGGHVFYAGNGRVQIAGNGQQSGIDIITPAGWGFMGFNGSGSMQLIAPGHMDYVSQGGGNHNFYGGRIIANDNNAAGPNIDVHNNANVAIRGEASNADAIYGIYTGNAGLTGVVGVSTKSNGNALYGVNFENGHGGLIGGKDFAGQFWGGAVRINGVSPVEPTTFSYFGLGSAVISLYTGNSKYSLWADDAVRALQFQAVSDRRIKDIVGISNSQHDLEILNKIEITDYYFKDRRAKGYAPQKKVIGQQVAEIYPQAVSSNNKEFVPDIMKVSEAKSGWVKMLNSSLKKGERVRLIFENGNKPEELEILETNESGFQVSTTQSGKVFVYGREVNDFHVVDYEAISMLNVSATQELSKQVADLKKQLADRDAQLNTALGMLQTLQQEVTALKTASASASGADSEEK